ncbi:MAG: hypothetical protein K8H75_13340 [Sulfuricella sp.]|nr:hypothetical protein [Sulfuricella sp.]
MAIIISQKIREKLASKHNVTEEEVAQCFANRTGEYLLDSREDHASDPPTLWFISETNYARKLKVVFIFRDGNICLRTAFMPNEVELSIYTKYGK